MAGGAAIRAACREGLGADREDADGCAAAANDIDSRASARRTVDRTPVIHTLDVIRIDWFTGMHPRVSFDGRASGSPRLPLAAAGLPRIRYWGSTSERHGATDCRPQRGGQMGLPTVRRRWARQERAR